MESSSLGVFVKPNLLPTLSFEDDDIFINEEDEEDQAFDNAEYLQEVPYTSSSLDRSSIGSIPWADDAIKLNQLEWEKVEQALAGLDPLPADEDLRKEICDWQKKFPQLLGKPRTYHMKSTSADTLDIESLKLDSEDEDLDLKNAHSAKQNTTPRRISSSIEDLSITPTPPVKPLPAQNTDILCDMLQNFTLRSVPLKLNQREAGKQAFNKRKCASSSSSIRSSPTSQNVPITHANVQRLRMPPIINVLETTRKFRNLAGPNKNKSFVQLTQVPHAKSAVVQDQNARSRFINGHRSAWQLPLTANRFFNNRNSIVLPALSTRQQVMHQYNATQPHNRASYSTSSEVGTNNNSPLSTSGNLFRANMSKFANQNPLTTARRDVLLGFSSNGGSTTQTTQTSTSGRSISAAVQHPRATQFNALYLPYSASKFYAFK